MHTDYMGWFGLSWQEKIAKAMYSLLNDTDRKQLKSFWGAGGWNINLINALYNYYLTSGTVNASASDISEKSGIAEKIVQAFLSSVQSLAVAGTVDYKIYNPEQAQAAQNVKSDLLTPAPVKAIKTYGKLAAVIVGGIVAVQLLQSLKVTRS